MTAAKFIDDVLNSRSVPQEIGEQFAAIRVYRTGEFEHAIHLDILRRLKPWLRDQWMLHERCTALMEECAAKIENALEREKNGTTPFPEEDRSV